MQDLERADLDLHRRLIGPMKLGSSPDVRAALVTASEGSFDSGFIRDEWHLIIDARGVATAGSCRELPRLGGCVRVPVTRRDAAWAIFARARADLDAQGLTTRAEMVHRLAAHLVIRPKGASWSHVVVEEAQDISVAELKAVAAVAGLRPNGLFFAGDVGQRILRQAFPWASVGVDVRRRSGSLKVCYRTSRQIRDRSDRLLPLRLTEADGSEEERCGIFSVFEGLEPDFH